MEKWLRDNYLDDFKDEIVLKQRIRRVSELLEFEVKEVEELASEIGMPRLKVKRFLKAIENERKARAMLTIDDYEDVKNYNDLGTQFIGPPIKMKKNVGLVLLGETGVGKTTLLKSLEDFLKNKPYELIKTTPKGANVGFSQTMVTTANPYCNDEWDVEIIDTPGLCDTSGVDKDQQHMNSILTKLMDVQFNAICVLIKRGSTRATPALKYIVGEIKANLPRDVKDNFIVLMTRSDVPIPDEDTIGCVKILGLPTGNIIPINNSAYEVLDMSAYPEGSPTRRIVQRKIRANYKENQDFLMELLKMAAKFPKYEGDKIRVLKTKRDKLKEQIGLLQMTMNASFSLERELKEKIAELNKAAKDKNAYKDFVKCNSHQEAIHYKKDGKITTYCNSCSKSCHIDCSLSYGDNLTGCYAMSGDRCRFCRCGVSSHCHMGWATRYKTVSVQKEDPDEKKKFMNAKEREKLVENRKRIINQKIRVLKIDRQNYTLQVQELYKEINKIAIIGHNEDYLEYMRTSKKQILNDARLTSAQKREKLGFYDKAITTWKTFISVIKR